MQASYDAGVTDEFIEPIVVDGTPRLEPGDTAIFFNFRPDRGRQLSALLLDAGFDLTTMTRYSDELDCPVVFGEQTVPTRSPRCSPSTACASSTWRRRRSTRT